MTDAEITALIAEARTYARKEIVAESRDGEQMHRTVAEILTDLAHALEAAVADRDLWKKRCAEETIAWVDATRRADASMQALAPVVEESDQ